MPSADREVLVAPAAATFQVGLEPALNALTSLVFLAKAGQLSGLDPWIRRTAAAFSDDQRHTHRLVMQGLYYALTPERSWPSFSMYVDGLAAADPLTLRDRVLQAYAAIPPKEAGLAPPENLEDMLATQDIFMRFLLDRFDFEHIDVGIESDAYRYLTNPVAMQRLIVSHLRDMWNTVLAPEWSRVVPMMQASVDAFRQVDLSRLSNLEAAERVIGLPAEDCTDIALEQARRIVFVPSAHVGPYMGRFKANGTIWLVFGARLPEGTHVISPDLSRAEILVRLGALADDTRLRILKLIAENGERNSKDIMADLGLSQSAASRHLKQLSATGYLNERRCEGAKCYVLNSDRIESTLRAVSAYLEV